MINANIRTSKYLAAITGGFFIAVSPWTLCTLIIVGANIKLQEDVDFFVTWLALSNSFWNCLIYGLMNRKFRRAALAFTCGRWFKSFKDSIYIRSQDESRDFSEDSTAYTNYIRKQVRKKAKDGTMSTTASLTGSVSGTTTPNDSPKITHTRMPHKQVTDLIQETKGL